MGKARKVRLVSVKHTHLVVFMFPILLVLDHLTSLLNLQSNLREKLDRLSDPDSNIEYVDVDDYK